MALAMRFAGSQLFIPSATLPAAKVITGITAASPGVFTSTAHGFANGDPIYIDGVVGMTQVNGTWGIATAVAANTFQVTTATGLLNTTTFTAYASGGTAQGYTMLQMCEAKSVNFTGGTVDKTESTGMCDLSKTYEAGLSDVGSFTVSTNKLAQAAVQIALRTHKANGTKIPVKVAFPTPGTNGYCTLPSFVLSDNWQGAVGQIWSGDFGFNQVVTEIYHM